MNFRRAMKFSVGDICFANANVMIVEASYVLREGWKGTYQPLLW